MEDLVLTPWQNQGLNDATDFYTNYNEFSQKQTHNLVSRNRSIKKYFSSEYENLPKKKNFDLKIRQKQSQYSLQSHNFNQGRDCRPSKIDFHLFSCPLKQKHAQKDAPNRLSEKSYSISKQANINRSFEVLQTIYNPNSKAVKVLKQKSLRKHHTYSESNFQPKFVTRNTDRENQIIGLRKSLQQYNQVKNKFNQINIKKIEKITFANKENFLKKKFSYNDHLSKHIDHSFEVNYLQRLSFNSKLGDESNNNRTSLQNQLKYNGQTKQDINHLKETTNIFRNLKKKKRLNQLERYNLFGLRKTHKKQ